MDNIEFRGKRIDNGEWVYGDLLQYRVLPVIFDKDKKQHEVYGETVGQFTGIKDNNNIKIYSGDYIRCSVNYNFSWVRMSGVIIYRDLSGAFAVKGNYDDQESIERVVLMYECWDFDIQN